MSRRRLARRDLVAPVMPAATDPNRITQCSFTTSHGPVRVWSAGGVPYRLRVAGVTLRREWDRAAFIAWMDDPEVRAALGVAGPFFPPRTTPARGATSARGREEVEKK